MSGHTDQRLVLVALVAYNRWQHNGCGDNARALRVAMEALGLTGPLVNSFGGICALAEAAIAKAEIR